MSDAPGHAWSAVRWSDLGAASVRTGVPLVIVDDVRGHRPGEGFDSALFTPDELERAAQLRFNANRAEFLAARGIVRTVVASQVGLPPSAIRFEGARNEKPRLLGPECADIDVSVSHAGGRVACAFLREGAIGVDIEALDRWIPDIIALAQRVLSAAELDALTRAPRSDFDALFLRAWTRKEAVLKAIGVGLSIPTTGFDVLRWTGSGMQDMSPVRVDGHLYACQSLRAGSDLELAVACSAA